MLGADRLDVRVALQIRGQDRNGQRGVVVDLVRDGQLLDRESGLAKGVEQALRAPRAAGLREQAVDEGLVAGLQPGLDHGLAGQVAAGVEVGAGIAEALVLVLLLQVGQRVVAAGDDDPRVDRFLDQGLEGALAGMAHDLDAVGIGGHRLLELGDHLFGLPARVLLDQIDPQMLGRRLGPVGAGQDRRIAGVAAHLHVHGDLRCRRRRRQAGGKGGRGKQAESQFHQFVHLSLLLSPSHDPMTCGPFGLLVQFGGDFSGAGGRSPPAVMPRAKTELRRTVTTLQPLPRSRSTLRLTDAPITSPATRRVQ